MDVHIEVADNQETVHLSLTRQQFALLCGAMNEAIEAVDDWEFSTRLGFEKEFAREMRGELAAAHASLITP